MSFPSSNVDQIFDYWTFSDARFSGADMCVRACKRVQYIGAIIGQTRGVRVKRGKKEIRHTTGKRRPNTFLSSSRLALGAREKSERMIGSSHHPFMHRRGLTLEKEPFLFFSDLSC